MKKMYRSSVFGPFCVCLCVCLSAPGLAPLPIELDTWLFASPLVLRIGQNSIFLFFEILFFPSYAPFSIFQNIPCKLNWWLWEAQI